MSDTPQRPEESSTAFLKEIEEGRIIENVELLRMKLVGKKSGDPEDQKTKSALLGIKIREAMISENGTLHGITITYNTRTGEITSDPGPQFGDASIVRTYLLENGDQKSILLHMGGGMPASWEIDEALTGIKTGPETGTRRIMPERLIPGHMDLQGINEIWGESEYVDNAKGDLVILKTIREFNKNFGPPS